LSINGNKFNCTLNGNESFGYNDGIQKYIIGLMNHRSALRGNMNRLEEMIDEMAKAGKEVLPSKYWIELNKKNIGQLEKSGYDNFKRTLALNYFTFRLGFDDLQLKYLIRNLPFASVFRCGLKTLFSKRHEYFSFKHSITYNLHARMLWEFAVRQDKNNLLDKLFEPSEGNPPKVYFKRKIISQDLANSFLEFQSIMETGIDTNKINTIMELGGGYGRTAFVFLSLMNSIKYVMVDIPPALYVAEKYLSNQFPGKKIFTFRVFTNYIEVEEEFESSDIIFLLPSQLDLLPPKFADLFINISSFHEMRPDQIEYYFNQVDTLTRSYFYFKQWKETLIPFENLKLTENSYPVRKHWSLVYWRECKVQTLFFEALFEL